MAELDPKHGGNRRELLRSVVSGRAGGISPAGGAAGSSVGRPVPPELGLRLSEDAMRAFLSVRVGEGNSADLSPDRLLRFLRENGVVNGVHEPFLRQFAVRWNRSKRSIDNVPAAESLEKPGPGRPGKLELLVRRQDAPALDGRVDFRERGQIVEVVKGQELARWHPPEPGAPGRDVLGRIAPAPEAPRDQAPLGRNVELAPHDQGLVLALAAGFLRYQDGLLEVGDDYVVRGDVDYSVGNITYFHSVHVTGDVKNGFRLNVGGDLHIDGVVEDGFILCSGDVTVKTGVVGTGLGLITAKGDCRIGFATNQAIRSRDSILVERNSVNSSLFGAKVVQVLGHVVGGLIVTGELAQCGTVGNDSGTRTEIELGRDFLLQETLAAIDEKIRELEESLARLSLRINRFKEAHGREGLRPEEAAALLELRAVKCKIEEKMPLLREKKEGLAERIRLGYFRDNIKMKVEKKIYPGTVIKAASEALNFNEAVPGPRTIIYSEGRLKIF